jgi:hypothetical protein
VAITSYLIDIDSPRPDCETSRQITQRHCAPGATEHTLNVVKDVRGRGCVVSPWLHAETRDAEQPARQIAAEARIAESLYGHNPNRRTIVVDNRRPRHSAFCFGLLPETERPITDDEIRCGIPSQIQREKRHAAFRLGVRDGYRLDGLHEVIISV